MAQDKPKIKTQEPGTAPPSKQMPPQEPAKTPEQVAAEREAKQRPGSTVVITAEIQELIDREVARKVAESHRAKSDGVLPHQDEVNAREIARAVLTEQGYVCPAPPDLSVEEQIALRRVM